MTCQQAVDALTGRRVLLAHEGAPDALEKHLAVCPQCAGRLHRTESVRRLLRECCQRLPAPHTLRTRIACALPHRAA